MKRKIFIFSLLVLLFSACNSISYLPTPSKLNYHTKGMWFECEFPETGKVHGELIAVSNQELYILTIRGTLLTLQRNSISKGIIHIALTTNYPDQLSRAYLIPVLALTHGWFLILTLPINLAIVAPTVASHRTGTYIVEYPKAVTWEGMAKFARFPQGIPDGLDINTLEKEIARN